MTDLGVYIHYPWCRNRCSYCDFAIALPDPDIPHERYLEAVLAELALRAGEFSGRRLVSLYFGGGTPSLWPARFLGDALTRVRQTFEPNGALEVTLEANPVDCTEENFDAWRTAGVTRLSIGLQSVDPAELALLGRDHAMGEGLAALERARAAGWSSISADAIVGTPTGDHGRSTITRLIELGLPHLSVYELTFEEQAPLSALVRRGVLSPLSDDALADLYEEVHRRLCAAGYEHYEISSYARPGQRARHNQLYWTGVEYLGLGNGAASFWLGPAGGRRWTNPRSVKKYLAGQPPEVLELSPEDIAADRLWLGLRTSDGVPRDAFAGRETDLSFVLEAGLVSPVGDRIVPTLKGFLHSNQFLRRFAAAKPRAGSTLLEG